MPSTVRAVGKTTLLRQQFPRATTFDLLDWNLRTELTDGIEVWPRQLFCRRLWAGDWF